MPLSAMQQLPVLHFVQLCSRYYNVDMVILPLAHSDAQLQYFTRWISDISLLGLYFAGHYGAEDLAALPCEPAEGLACHLCAHWRRRYPSGLQPLLNQLLTALVI